MSQAQGEARDEEWADGGFDGIFELPPDHVVVALRERTGHAHLGWRKPSHRERLRCAALLASEQFRLETAEACALDSTPQPEGLERATTLLSQVMSTDASTSSGVQAVSAVLAVEELLSVLQATVSGYLARLADPGVAGDPTGLAEAPGRRGALPGPAVYEAAHQLATAQVGAALCISPAAASRRIVDAEDLVTGPVAVREALRKGRIDPRRARALLEKSAVLDFGSRVAVADRLVPLALDCTPSRWAAMVDAAVIAADPVGAEERRQKAAERRRLRLERAEDGMATFIADLTAPDAQLAWDVFDAIGRALEGMDDRCIDHRRADAFATMIELLAAGETVSAAGLIELALEIDHETCCGEAPASDHTSAQRSESPADTGVGAGIDEGRQAPAPFDGSVWNPRRCTACGSRAVPSGGRGRSWSLPTRQGRRTHLTVVLTLDALAGLINDPATLQGQGTITAEMARTLAEAASTVNLLVGDPESGAVLGAGQWTYRPRQEVRDHVLTVYPTCIFTGCDRRAHDSQLDHRDEFCRNDPESGGATTRRNMFPLCRLHHRLKTFSAWTYERTARTVEFRSPLGLTSVTRHVDPVVLHGLRSTDPDPPDTPPPF